MKPSAGVHQPFRAADDAHQAGAPAVPALTAGMAPDNMGGIVARHIR